MLAKRKGIAAVIRLGVAAFMVGIASGQVSAQSDTQWDSLYDRIIRLEYRLDSLEAGGIEQDTATSIDPSTNASQSLRVDRVEGDLRTLLGQVQELAHQVQQLSDRLKRFSEDTEYRFQELEGGANRGDNDTSRPKERTANSDDFNPPDYGDLNTLEQYPQEPRAESDPETALPPGTKPLGTIPESALGDETTTLSAVPDEVTAKPLDDPTGGADSAKSLYRSAYDDLLKRRFGAAEAGFARFLKKHGKHKLAGNAQYWLGETYYARGQYKLAAKAFLSGYRDFEKGAKAPASMLKLGMSLRRLGQKNHACATFGQLKQRFPKASANIKRLALRESKRAGCGG